MAEETPAQLADATPAEDPTETPTATAAEGDDGIPDGVTADYVNEEAQGALAAFQATPDYEHLAAFLNALRTGYLVVDVTGEPSKKKRHRIRTIRSTTGKLVLPLFTSMAGLRAIVPGDRQHLLRGAVMPATVALGLIATDRFVAAEIDKSGASLVLLRKYVVLAASSDEITAESLAAMK